MSENADIYDLLNDIPQDLSIYEEVLVDNKELAKWKKSFLERCNKRRSSITKINTWKMVVAASVILLTMAFSNSQVRAGISMAIYYIQDILGIETSMTDYSIPINTIIENEYVSIAIGDVIVDNQNLYIIYSCESINEISNVPIGIEISINGKWVNSSSRSCIYEIDGTKVYMSEIYLPYIDLTKENLYKMGFYIDNNDGTTCELGDVSFISSAEKMMGNTVYTELNTEIVIDERYKLNLENYSSNYITQGIQARIIDNEIKEYRIVLRGTDNFGRIMYFYMSETYDDVALFRLAYENQEETLVDMSGVDSFEVTPYYIKNYQYSGINHDTELEKAGEPFSIYVK